ncbi:SIMPL domain-containing protein [Pseudoxanthomonas indica]|uniref:SIMPL domain-containing protein n=1 Tax=Pseudoxanthomonas indica TaxID=428993 RepID=A0A1T5KRY3_9GAMM|nr:SIMPL domain-containing protein [Pseudoxanthomonas indica]GGD51059.1 oxidative stress defense protein [Pseudoxanthomonas indica]SKC66285.1 hypothetical protein SAMN06296058_1950 [Pseudoxanthomonas indica]
MGRKLQGSAGALSAAMVTGAMVLTMGLAGTAWAGTALPDGPHISVSGEGKVSAKPDQVRLVFEFESRNAQVLPAKQSVDNAVNKVLALLPGFGIEDADVTASELSASEDIDYSNSGRRISNGYEASRRVTVVLKDIGRVNQLIDAGLAAGASGFGGVDFESSQAEQLREQARAMAAENARSKASASVKHFGATLGPIYSIGSVNSQSPDRYGATLDAVTVSGSRRRSEGVYLRPSVEFVETVQVVFDVKR